VLIVLPTRRLGWSDAELPTSADGTHWLGHVDHRRAGIVIGGASLSAACRLEGAALSFIESRIDKDGRLRPGDK
jgi:hypothetical protein